jgi:hypothetical protein
MSTAELERLLVTALHEGDDTPVDFQHDLSRLAARQRERQGAAQRWSVAAVAAAVVGLLVVASVVLAVKDARDDSRPISPAPAPRFGLSPSGLPVGTLVGGVDRTEPGVTSTLRLVVRPDGTGSFNAGTVGDREGDSVADYEVAFVAAGPGHALMRNESHAACFTPDLMTLHFVVHERSVRIVDLVSGYHADCLVSSGLRAGLPGTTLRIKPLPVELSPSGLPVGLLKGQYPFGRDVGTIRLLVRPDGTGQLEFTERVHHNQTGPFAVELLAGGRGSAVMRSVDALFCDDPEMMSLTFTTVRSTVTILRADAPGTCLVARSEASAMSGTVLNVLPGSLGNLTSSD